MTIAICPHCQQNTAGQHQTDCPNWTGKVDWRWWEGMPTPATIDITSEPPADWKTKAEKWVKGLEARVQYWVDKYCEMEGWRDKLRAKQDWWIDEATTFRAERNTACRHAVRLEERLEAAREVNSLYVSRNNRLMTRVKELEQRLENIAGAEVIVNQLEQAQMRIKEQGGRILVLELDLCEKAEHIKGLEGERDQLVTRAEERKRADASWEARVKELEKQLVASNRIDALHARGTVTLHGEAWDEDCGEAP